MIALAVIGVFALVAFGPPIALAVRRRTTAATRRDLDEWRDFNRRMMDADACIVARIHKVHSPNVCPRCKSPQLPQPPREPLHREGEYR